MSVSGSDSMREEKVLQAHQAGTNASALNDARRADVDFRHSSSATSRTIRLFRNSEYDAHPASCEPRSDTEPQARRCNPLRRESELSLPIEVRS